MSRSLSASLTSSISTVLSLLQKTKSSRSLQPLSQGQLLEDQVWSFKTWKFHSQVQPFLPPPSCNPAHCLIIPTLSSLSIHRLCRKLSCIPWHQLFIHQTFLARHTHIRKNRPSLLGIKSSGLIHLIDESFYPFPTFSSFPYTRFPGQPVFYCRVLRLTFFLRFYIWVIPCGICLYLANFT